MPPPAPVGAPSAAPLTASPEERQIILKRLADGELTKAEAEEQLSQLGSPVPAAMPSPPSANSGAGKGCLIAALVILGPVLLIFLLVGILFFVRYRAARMHSERVMVEQLQHAQQMEHAVEMRSDGESVIIGIEEEEEEAE